MDRRELLSLVGAVALAGCDEPAAPAAPSQSGSAAPPPPEPFRFGTDLDAGVARATREKRPLILFFTAAWSVACKELEKSFTTPAVEHAAHGFVGVLVDVSDNENDVVVAKMRAYDVRNVPAVIVTDSSGREVHRGYAVEPPETWVERLREVG
ncbi:MAG: thioredoxin family protein [Myxococcales bacterium]|nr:thioredoxin family protein [Myxococcales bacterium]